MLTESQKQIRSKGVGGSETSSVLGVNPYQTARELALEKLGAGRERTVTKPMQRGVSLEPLVLKMVKEQTGISFHKPKETLVHPNYDWLVASMDGVGPKGVIAEIKCPNLSSFLKVRREGVPVNWQTQAQHYMLWPKIKRCLFVIFSAELWEMEIVELNPDPEFAEIIIEKTGEFWRNLQQGIIPEEPTSQSPVIDLPAVGASQVIKLSTPEWLSAVSELREAQEIRQEAEEFEKEAKSRLAKLMGDYEIAESENLVRIYNKLQNGRTTLDTKRMRQDFPDLPWSQYEKHGQPFKSFRAFWLGNGGQSDE